MLRDEGSIQFQVCRNPDLKLRSWNACNVRFAIDSKYFTHKNTYRYIHVLPKFVKAYNDTVHSMTGMAPPRVTDSDVLAKWKRMEEVQGRVRFAKAAVFRVGQNVRVSKDNMQFAKFAHNISAPEF